MLAAQDTKLVTVEQAAAHVELSVSTLRRALRDGELRYSARRGRTMLLRLSDVEEWKQNRNEVQLLDE